MRTLKEFAELVDGMRVAQRSYFRSRNPDSLLLSKQREAQVDGAIAAILSDETGMFSQPTGTYAEKPLDE